MLTDKEEIELLRLLEEEEENNARSDYYSYVKYTHDDYMYNKHGEFISNVIDDAIRKRDSMIKGDIPIESQYIMLSVPPRHGKSMHISETLPSYVMGKYKKFKVIMTAYSSTLAHDFAKSNSNKIKQQNIFGVKVTSDNQDRMTLDNGSEMIKAGILGGITGKGAHLLIIDDPIKTSEEARSEVQRDKIWKEWVSSLSTRLEIAPIVIVIMTRWHEDDLCGRLLNPEYGKPLPWNVINLPLEAEENDILGRTPGQPLWPERYGIDFIEIRKRYPEDFNALYQGRPVAAEGNMIKKEWFEDDKNWYVPTPEFLSKIPIICMSVDATFKDTSKSDKVDIQVWGQARNSFFLIDNLNARMDFLATLQAIRNFKQQYPRIGMIFVEDKANGSAIMNVLNKEMTGIVPVNPLGGKESRVQSVLPYLVGNVKLPRNKGFVSTMLQEWYAFPNGAHDDSVDSMTQAISQMIYFYGEVQRKNTGVKDAFFGTTTNNDNTICGDLF